MFFDTFREGGRALRKTWGTTAGLSEPRTQKRSDRLARERISQTEHATAYEPDLA